MAYNFIKEEYAPFIENAGSSGVENFIPQGGGYFILKHNTDALAQLLKFINSSDNIFILNGFTGSGKTYIADCFLDFISDDVLVFRNSYQEAINLDDVLLSIFRDFSIYHNEHKVNLPNQVSSIFSEKINTYVKSADAPMLFIFDSFDINMRSKDSQKDILDFINYLSHFEKVKVILCSRAFRQDSLISPEGARSFELKPLSIDEVRDYFSENKIQGTPYETEELFKASRGHYILAEMSVLIMKTMKMPLSVFLNEYKNTSGNFLEFLVSKILMSASEKYTKLLVFLTAARHGVSGGFLVNQYLASEDDINFLLQRMVIAEKFGRFYMKDYVKNQYVKKIIPQTRIRIHKYLADVYEAELPLKPFDRELFLSRLTMRREIEYHAKKVQEIQKVMLQPGNINPGGIVHNFKYISYARTGGFEPDMENKQLSSLRAEPVMKPRGKAERFELSNEDSKLLNAVKTEDAAELQMKKSTELEIKQDMNKKPQSAYNQNEVPDSLDEYIEIAQNYEKAFNFSSAIVYYKKALTYKTDAMYKLKAPVIYTKLAICHKKIQDTDTAVKYFEKVCEIYLKEAPEKAAAVLLSIAQIYSENYKFDKAKEVYNRILYSPAAVSDKMKIKVYLDLSEIEDSNLNTPEAAKYAKKALSEAEKLSDIPLLCECYYRCALMLDDGKNTNLAVKYYLRCVQTSNDASVNEYAAPAYSNLAEISMDAGNIQAAKMYCETAISAYKIMEDYEGLYYSSTKLSELYKNENPDKAHELLAAALGAAKQLEDAAYTVSAYIEIGDFYADQKRFKQALKSYVLVKSLSGGANSADLREKINNRINTIKLRIGESEFLRLMTEIKKKK